MITPFTLYLENPGIVILSAAKDLKHGPRCFVALSMTKNIQDDKIDVSS
jgi:hypothetical protein